MFAATARFAAASYGRQRAGRGRNGGPQFGACGRESRRGLRDERRQDRRASFLARFQSAGVSRDGITHERRAEIYVQVALRVRLCLPRVFSFGVAYFLRRARRHIRKSAAVDNVERSAHRWIFSQLGRVWLRDRAMLRDVLNRRVASHYFPFCEAQNSRMCAATSARRVRHRLQPSRCTG